MEEGGKDIGRQQKLLSTSLNKLEKNGAISLLTPASFWPSTKKGTLYVFLKAL